jgi:hypothetical protein
MKKHLAEMPGAFFCVFVPLPIPWGSVRLKNAQATAG